MHSELGSPETDLDAPRQARDTASRVWLITFTDLVSLLLTFFVMLFAMSSVPADKWDKFTDALSRSFGPGEPGAVKLPMAQFNIGTIFRRQAINLDYLSGVLADIVAKDPLLSRGRLLRYEDRLIITLPGDLLFEAGRAAMSAGAEAALFTLGGVLRNIGNQIAVNGHSDPAPPEAPEYASNWEMSTARAAAVANALKRYGYTEDIIAVGFSDGRFHQLPALPEAERRLRARRVDIVVLPTVGEP